MASLLHPFPRFIFTIVEPIADLLGCIYALTNPALFLSSQDPITPLSPPVLEPAVQALTLQFSNFLFLLALFTVAVLQTTTERRVVKAYLLVLAVTDLTHVGLSAWAVGWNRFCDVGVWPATAWINYGFPCAIMLVRLGTLGGWGWKKEGVKRE